MSAPFESTDSSFENVVLADAMAERQMRNQELHDRIDVEVSGEQIAVVSAQLRHREKLGRAALILQNIQNPTRPTSLAETIDAAMQGRGEYRSAVKGMGQGGEPPISEEGYRRAFQDTIGGFEARMGKSPEDQADDLAKTLAAAQEIATEQDVDVATVFWDDQLNLELERRTTTFEELIEEYTKGIQGLSGEFVHDMESAFVKGMLPEEASNYDRLALHIGLAVDRAIDSGYREEITHVIDQARETLRQLFVYKTAELWDPHKINGLTKEQRQVLLPKRGLVPTVQDMVLRRQ